MSEKKKKDVVDEHGNLKKQLVKGPHIRVDSDFTAIYDHNAADWIRDTNMVLNMLAMKEKYLNQKTCLLWSSIFYTKFMKNLVLIFRHWVLIKFRPQEYWDGYDPSEDGRDCYISMGLFDRMGNRNEYAMEALEETIKNYSWNFNVDGDILTGKNGSKTFAQFRKVI